MQAIVIKQPLPSGDQWWWLRIPNDANAIEYIIQSCFPLDQDEKIIIQSVMFMGAICIDVYYSNWSGEDYEVICASINKIL